MKVVYVLTTGKEDFYLEQLAISLESLRNHNPEIEVELVMDNESYDSLDFDRMKMIEKVSKISSFEVPRDFNKMQKSRWLKTNLRNLINDDFLFIDTDTIICRPLDFGNVPLASICAVCDKHMRVTDDGYKSLLEWAGRKINWKVNPKIDEYYNSGVILVRDTKEARDFYKRWHEEWSKHLNQCSYDQPSFGKTNTDLGHVIKPLSDEWNCQIMENGIRYFDDAFIIHYFASGQSYCKKPYIFSNKYIYEAIRKDGFTEEIKELIIHPHSAFISNVTLLSDTDIKFFNSALCVYLKEFYYKAPKVYTSVQNFLRSVKRFFIK